MGSAFSVFGIEEEEECEECEEVQKQYPSAGAIVSTEEPRPSYGVTDNNTASNADSNSNNANSTAVPIPTSNRYYCNDDGTKARRRRASTETTKEEEDLSAEEEEEEEQVGEVKENNEGDEHQPASAENSRMLNSNDIVRDHRVRDNRRFSLDEGEGANLSMNTSVNANVDTDANANADVHAQDQQHRIQKQRHVQVSNAQSKELIQPQPQPQPQAKQSPPSPVTTPFGWFTSLPRSFFPRTNSKRDFVTTQYRKISRDFTLGKVIGQGHYGRVRTAVRKQDKMQFAVKTILKKKVKRIELLKREIEVLRRLAHPNVVKLHDVYEDDTNLHLVLDLCTGGELFERIIDEGAFSEEKASLLVAQMLDMLRYCHSLNVVHRDLKPENFLFANEEPDSPLKVIDFGLARFFKEEEETSGTAMMHTRVGTPYYLAPEILKRNYTEKCDIWSVGVIVYILLCGYPPFNGNNDRAIFDAVRKGRVRFPAREWRGTSVAARSFIYALLNPDLVNRPSADLALSHPWLHAAVIQLNIVVTQKWNRTSPTSQSRVRQRSGSTPPSLPAPLHNPLAADHVNKHIDRDYCQDDGSFEEKQKQGEGKRKWKPEAKEEKGADHEHEHEHEGEDEDEDEEEEVEGGVLCRSALESLRKFARLSKLKREIFTIVARQLSVAELEQLIDHFSEVDADGNGRITTEELAAAMDKIGLSSTSEDLRRIMDVVDVDGNGTIEFREFQQAAMMQRELVKDDVIHRAFDYFDASAKGILRIEDLCESLCTDPIDAKSAESVLREIDTNNDGYVDRDEFKAMVNSLLDDGEWTQ